MVDFFFLCFRKLKKEEARNPFSGAFVGARPWPAGSTTSSA
jgi:hypothetical protein